ncbi:MAG: hypothetical protein N2109_00690 [Fimbriimonadales bacterium]|nr:hypothetical protein [Fimbriimonadales bacterium]
MIKMHFRRVALFSVLGVAVALVVGLFLPTVWEARTEILFGAEDSRRVVGATTDPVDQILQLGNQGTVETELQIIRSESTFASALESAARKLNDASLLRDYEDLYLMYDVKGQEMSRIAQVRVRAYSQEAATSIADEIGRVYNELRQQAVRKSVVQAQEYLDSQVRSAERDVRDAERRLERFKIERGFTDFSTRTAEATRYEQDLERLLDKAQTELRGVQAAIARQRGKLAETPRFSLESRSESKNPIVSQLEQQLADYQRQRVEALRFYREDSVKIRNLDEVIREWEQKLLEAKRIEIIPSGRQTATDPVRRQLELQLAGNEVQLTSLKGQIAALERELQRQRELQRALPRDEVELRRLVRELEILDSKYRRLKAQSEDLKDRTETIRVSAQVLAPARLMRRPVSPDYLKLGFIGLVCGLCMGLLYTSIVEAMRLRVSTSNQLSELTGLPVSATVPKLPARAEEALIAAVAEPDARPLESFRYLAFASSAKFESLPRVVLFTSAQGADATLAAAQFSLALAQTGLRTLLVDADLKRATASDRLLKEPKPGVSDLLGRAMLPTASSDLLVQTKQENLWFLPAGSANGASLADFQTPLVVGLLETLKSLADVVVLDLPACDVLSDAARMAKLVDDVYLVVSARETPYRQVPQAQDILTQSGAKSVSLILADASPGDEPFSNLSV